MIPEKISDSGDSVRVYPFYQVDVELDVLFVFIVDVFNVKIQQLFMLLLIWDWELREC